MKPREWMWAVIALISAFVAAIEHSQKCEYRGRYEALKDVTGKAFRESSRQAYNNGRTQEKLYNQQDNK